MAQGSCEIGIIGLGVKGRTLALNFAAHGIGVAAWDSDQDRLDTLLESADGDPQVMGAGDLDEFAGALGSPKIVAMFVPRGESVDEMIRLVRPRLGVGDILIDGSDSHFADTRRRHDHLAADDISYFGAGFAGTQADLRHGPSIMVGGPEMAWETIEPLLWTIAAKVDDEVSLAWVGPVEAGHYVKMVHDALEQTLVQLIGESCDFMKRSLGLNDDQLRSVFTQWNESEVRGRAIESAAAVVGGDGGRDEPNGAGARACREAMDLQVPAPCMAAAVAGRDMFRYEDLRAVAEVKFEGRHDPQDGDTEAMVHQLKLAAYATMLISFSEGFWLLRSGSEAHDYSLDLPAVARLWRGGSPLRGAVLDCVCEALSADPDTRNVLLDDQIAWELSNIREDLREIVAAGIYAGLPVPVLSAAVGAYDGLSSPWLPTELVHRLQGFLAP